MDEVASGSPASFAAPERVGSLLRAARERQGLTLSEVASRTRVPMRHLEAIEGNNYAGLPSTTYATGFARAYARAVGADEVEVARGVRAELAGVVRPVREYQPYEPTDPSRVPSRGLALTALGMAMAVLILAGLWFGTDLFRGNTASQAVPPTVAAPAVVVPVPAPASQVLVTATDEVWVRIYDRDDQTLHQGTLKAGEHFEVPAEAADPQINVGRPDKLRITINGSIVQGLDLGNKPIKDVRVSAAALTARAAGEPTPSASPTSSASLTPTSSPTARPTTTAAAPTSRPDRGGPDTPARSETARASLDVASEALAPASLPGNAQ